jgi:protein-disulfide isomerase
MTNDREIAKGSCILLAAIVGIGGFSVGCTNFGAGSDSSETADVEAAAVEVTGDVEAAPPAPPAQTPAKPDPNQVYDIPKPKNAPSQGSPNAKVVIQQFSDFQCPYCSDVAPLMAQVMEEFGDKVQIIWRNYPLTFHEDASPAAQAALEVFEQKGNKAFWAYHDVLFANQRALSRADLEKYAEQVGSIDMKAFRAALDSEKHKAAVDADKAAVAEAGAQIGTPAFFFNGKLMQGAQRYPAFKFMIDRALNE